MNETMKVCPIFQVNPSNSHLHIHGRKDGKQKVRMEKKEAEEMKTKKEIHDVSLFLQLSNQEASLDIIFCTEDESSVFIRHTHTLIYA